MQLEARAIDIGTEQPLVLLNTDDAEELGAHPLDRVRISHDRTETGIVKLTDELVAAGELGVTEPLEHVSGTVDVVLAGTPQSVQFLRKKLDDIELDAHELQTIVDDIHENRLSDVELGAYVSAVYTNGLSLEETKHLTEAMSDAGPKLRWDATVVADKHSIGGIAGNCITPIVVSIVTAAGVTMPKTSSRAVTSPAGTADVMDVLCDVEFTLPEIEAIVAETNGCLVWGGGVDLSPVDDDIIRAENPLSLDPPGQVMASVLSKKRAAGSTHVILDIPYGEGAKVGSLDAARELAEDFERVGDHLDMAVTAAITHGNEPVGQGIGPALEARDVLAVLDGGGPASLRVKAVQFADHLFEHCSVDASATEILDSGRAREQFERILGAQNGDPDVETTDLDIGPKSSTVTANRAGIVSRIDNRQICDLARHAGAPRDTSAGLEFHCEVHDEVEAGDDLYTIYARRQSKLDEAEGLADSIEPVRIRGRGDTFVERR